MKRVFKELDSIASLWIEDDDPHDDSHHDHHPVNMDFLDVMLSFVEGRTDQYTVSANNDESESYIKAIALEELDTIVGKLITVNESDVENLPYLRAVVKESLRLYPPAPLGGPHETTEDCSIGGFHVPAGTRVLANLY
ncbi:hypothetical protein H6P81_020958 [Aristolochia fimbriata]|uniref:Cytochrome P450 n=1 Tax=Aristolochia fimbriata TaxID=158543 RepID=A0AAV7E051_ARIFI|nr:hypothetical protein H6P81_020958 [Aristolochia fimbriata]